MRLRAKMTFHNQGAFVRQDEEFSATESDAEYLIENGFAEKVSEEKSVAPAENKTRRRKVDEE